MKALSYFTIAFFALFLTASAMAQGGLDVTFGDQGIVKAPVTTLSEQGLKVLVQPDGKILIAGMQDENNIRDFAVARYNADGSPDNSFGTGGLAIFDGGTDSDGAWTMALQDDGKIIIGGSVYNQFSTVDDFSLVRFNANGTPDNTFGTGGLVITDIDGYWDNAYDMVLQPDGKILLGGDGYTNDKRNACVVRYNADGSLDASFGTGGIAIHSIGLDADHIKAIALQTDGKILAAGFLSDGIDDQTVVTRFNIDGTLDNTFGNNGKATLDIGGNDDRIWDVHVLDDGRILCGGYTKAPSTEVDYLLLKYLADGTLDNSFGSNGIKMHNIGLNDFLIEMAVQTDGKIISAGGGFTFELVRFLEDGTLDVGFGNNGVVNTPIGTMAFAQSVCLQDDGKIIVGGNAKNSPDEFDFALARYHAEGGGFISETNSIFHEVSIYPNPASGGSVNLGYMLQTDEKISIELITINGQLVGRMLDNVSQKAGEHYESLQLPGDLAPGIYLVRLNANQGSTTILLEIN